MTTTTSIAFVAPITIPGTTTKQSEFRADQGWTVQPSMGRVDLEHVEHGKLIVIGVGYALRTVEHTGGRYSVGTTTVPDEVVKRQAADSPEVAELLKGAAPQPLPEGAVVVTQAGGQVILPPEPGPPETLRQWRKGKR